MSGARPDGAELDFGGARLRLLPGRAVLLPDDATLLVADVHVGKAVRFRRLGIPVPHGTTAETLRRLSALLDAHAVRRLVFLGDLLHAPQVLVPTTLATLRAWRERHAAVAMHLVRGNHDVRAGDPPAALAIEPVDEPWRLAGHDGLALGHHPRRQSGVAVLAGHLHPCVTLAGPARDRHRLPCFWFGAGLGVLPAFGAFTGMHPIRPAPADRVFVVTPERVAELARG